jgi:hypothetical protein
MFNRTGEDSLSATTIESGTKSQNATMGLPTPSVATQNLPNKKGFQL